MVIPVGTAVQDFIQIDRRSDGKFVKTVLMGVRYVPLVKVDPSRMPPRDKGSTGSTEASMHQRRRSGDLGRLAADGKKALAVGTTDANKQGNSTDVHDRVPASGTSGGAATGSGQREAGSREHAYG